MLSHQTQQYFESTIDSSGMALTFCRSLSLIPSCPLVWLSVLLIHIGLVFRFFRTCACFLCPLLSSNQLRLSLFARGHDERHARRAGGGRGLQ